MAEHHDRRVHTKPVVLDIGQDRGALVIVTTEAFHGHEIEISPWHAEEQRTHQDVAERHVNGHVTYAAVFPSLPAGDYHLWGPDPAHPSHVTITGGEVAQVDWRTA